MSSYSSSSEEEKEEEEEEKEKEKEKDNEEEEEVLPGGVMAHLRHGQVLAACGTLHFARAIWFWFDKSQEIIFS